MTETYKMNMEKQEFSFWNKLSSHRCNIEDMVGKKITGIYYDYENFQVMTDDGCYAFYHAQDCCEDVVLTQVDGDLEKILGSVISRAEEVTNTTESHWGSVTWTFYKIFTPKGIVDFRWQGSSNGWYSETVTLVKIKTQLLKTWRFNV